MDEGTQVIIDGDSVKVVNNDPVIVYQGTKEELDGQISDLQNGINDLQSKMEVLVGYRSKFSA